MPPAFPQELIDKIVDDVHTGLQFPDQVNTLALLRAAPCFGPRCRKYLYHTVYLALEMTDPSVTKKILDVKSLRFVELVRRTPSLAHLVESVHYNLYFELDDTSCIASTPAWHTLRKLAQNLTRVDMVTLQFYDTRHSWDNTRDEDLRRMTLDSNVLEAICLIIPSCPFSGLMIGSTSLLPNHLLELLAHCPHVGFLELSDVGSPWGDSVGESGTLQAEVQGPHPKIEDLTFFESDDFFFAMFKDGACRSLFASTRRLVFEFFDTAHSSDWDAIGDFISQLMRLETVSFDGDHYGTTYDVRALVHAPSLHLRMRSAARIPDLSSAFRQNPGYPSKLRRLALIVYLESSYDFHISVAHWRELASVLHQSRFAALETICITFGGQSERHPHLVEDVLQCFSNAKFSVEATVI